jgi:hypothetical protein
MGFVSALSTMETKTGAMMYGIWIMFDSMENMMEQTLLQGILGWEAL